jgi:hypothetical protein
LKPIGRRARRTRKISHLRNLASIFVDVSPIEAAA